MVQRLPVFSTGKGGHYKAKENGEGEGTPGDKDIEVSRQLD